MYEFKCGGGGCGVSANEYSCAHGAQINLDIVTRRAVAIDALLPLFDRRCWGGGGVISTIAKKRRLLYDVWLHVLLCLFLRPSSLPLFILFITPLIPHISLPFLLMPLSYITWAQRLHRRTHNERDKETQMCGDSYREMGD